MTKDLSSFMRKVNNTVRGTLEKYSPEIRVALGPASITFKANRVQESGEQELSER